MDSLNAPRKQVKNPSSGDNPYPIVFAESNETENKNKQPSLSGTQTQGEGLKSNPGSLLFGSGSQTSQSQSGFFMSAINSQNLQNNFLTQPSTQPMTQTTPGLINQKSSSPEVKDSQSQQDRLFEASNQPQKQTGLFGNQSGGLFTNILPTPSENKDSQPQPSFSFKKSDSIPQPEKQASLSGEGGLFNQKNSAPEVKDSQSQQDRLFGASNQPQKQTGLFGNQSGGLFSNILHTPSENKDSPPQPSFSFKKSDSIPQPEKQASLSGEGGLFNKKSLAPEVKKSQSQQGGLFGESNQPQKQTVLLGNQGGGGLFSNIMSTPSEAIVQNKDSQDGPKASNQNFVTSSSQVEAKGLQSQPTGLFSKNEPTTQPPKGLFENQLLTQGSGLFSKGSTFSLQPQSSQTKGTGAQLPQPGTNKSDTEVKNGLFGASTTKNKGDSQPSSNESQKGPLVSKSPFSHIFPSNSINQSEGIFGSTSSISNPQPLLKTNTVGPFGNSSSSKDNGSNILSSLARSASTSGASSIFNAPPTGINLFKDISFDQSKPLFPGVQAFNKVVVKFQKAIKKEDKVREKITKLIKKIKENKDAMERFFEEKEKELDQFFEKVDSFLTDKIKEKADEYKDSLKEKLNQKYEDFKKINIQVQTALENMIADKNTFQKLLDQTLNGLETEDQKGLVEKCLNESFELSIGLTPLVKKFKLLKNALPSIDLLISRVETKIIDQEFLQNYLNKISDQLENKLKDLFSSIDCELSTFSHPLSSFVQAIQDCSIAKSAILPSGYPIKNLNGPFSNAENVKIMKYSLLREEAEAAEIFKGKDRPEIIYTAQPVSVHYDVSQGDLISYNGAPQQVLSKNLKDGTSILFLENIFTKKREQVSFHAKWQYSQDLILTEEYIIFKKKKTYYSLINLDQTRNNTASLIKLVSFNNVLKKVKDQIDKMLENKKMVIVKTIFYEGNEIIVSANEIQSYE